MHATEYAFGIRGLSGFGYGFALVGCGCAAANRGCGVAGRPQGAAPTEMVCWVEAGFRSTRGPSASLRSGRDDGRAWLRPGWMRVQRTISTCGVRFREGGIRMWRLG